MIWLRSYFHRLGQAFAATGRVMLRHEIPRDAASISYFSLAALIPAMLVLIALADAFLGWMNLHRTVIQRVVNFFPGSRQFLRSNLDDMTNPSSAVVLSCVVIVLWSSSWIFTFIESATDRAWNAPSQRTFWERRLLSVAFMALSGISLLASAVITAVISDARAHIGIGIPISATASHFIGWFWYLTLFGTGLLIAILVFTLMFKLIPHCKVLWIESFSGAMIATVLWEIGSLIFVKLMPFFDYQKVYGRMGAFIALLVLIYTSNIIVLFGANFSAQMNRTAAKKNVQELAAISNSRIRRFPTGL
jgi:membrane protein